MRIGQISLQGACTAAVFESGIARPIPGYTLVDVIRRAETDQVSLSQLATLLASRHGEPDPPVIPIRPLEVWACGHTFETNVAPPATSAVAPDIYEHVFRAPRPEIFFKGTARVCVGPGRPVGIRSDSTFTVPEPELALVLGSKGRILGYTLANDMSARDIEAENPLYHAQSKIYTGCCALGPVIVTADEITDPYALEITCTVSRGGSTLFTGSVSTSLLRRRLDALVEFLLRSNPVPAGSVLLAGTGIVAARDAALAPGDIVSICAPMIGELLNPVTVV